MVSEDSPLVYMIFEDGTVWKIQRRRLPMRYWYWHDKIPAQFFNRPQELEKFDFVWNGTLYGTNETVWWGYDPQRVASFDGDGYAYNSKTKETLRFVRLIRDFSTNCLLDSAGVLFDKRLNCLVKGVKHFLEHQCFVRKFTNARGWVQFPRKPIGGFICRKVGSNSSKDFYLVGTKEAEHRFEFKDFRRSQHYDKTQKRKEKKQVLSLQRRKKRKTCF